MFLSQIVDKIAIFKLYKMAISFFIKIFSDKMLKVGVSLRLLDLPFHIKLANFFRFMHEKIRLISISIFDKPLNFVYLIPCFSFVLANTRSTVFTFTVIFLHTAYVKVICFF